MIAHTVVFTKDISKEQLYKKDIANIIHNIFYIQRKYPFCQSFCLSTDLDTSIDPGMFIARLHRYFLLPKKVELSQEHSADCIIFLCKNDYKKFLTDQYVIADHFSSRDAIAVKKGTKVDD